MTAKGYAIAEHGNILPNTVHTGRRGALAQWLIEKAHIPVLPTWSDDLIDRLWTANRGRYAELVAVTIEIDQ